MLFFVMNTDTSDYGKDPERNLEENVSNFCSFHHHLWNSVVRNVLLVSVQNLAERVVFGILFGEGPCIY